MKPNFSLIPVTVLPANDENAEKFNKIYEELMAQDEFSIIKRTPSGGISYMKGNYKLPCWDITKGTSYVTLTILYNGCRRITFRYKSSEEERYFRWWKEFIRICNKFDVDLRDYADIENGKKHKSEIPKYLIKEGESLVLDKTYTGVHHVDFRSSFGAGVIKNYPELAPVYNYFFDNRKRRPEYKSCITNSVGKFQSELVQYRWAHIARDAIQDNNDRVNELADRLRSSGRAILLFNTDGIWYMGDIYHGEGEGDSMGEWHNDHINCTFRAKSKGAYEYIENEVYTPVLRGNTDYDYVVDRKYWKWGDIYRTDCNPIKYKFVKYTGIVRCNDENE